MSRTNRIGLFLVCALFASLSQVSLAADESASPRLAAPREVFSSEDVTFKVTASPDTTGDVNFDLKTYAGKSVWTRSAPIESGNASVVLKADEAGRMAKGNRVPRRDLT